jgi:leucyl-tRNA synthetase
MSKSLRNVVNPDSIVEQFGADTLRLYEMYMGPLEASKPWNTRDIIGVHRFLQRVWRLVVVEDAGRSAGWSINPRIVDRDDDALERLLHRTIQKVEGDIERFSFNTAIAQMIVWVNEAQKCEAIGRSQVRRFLQVLAPFAPHIGEELWQRLGGDGLIAAAGWPAFDEALTRDETVEIAVQVNGRLRGRLQAPVAATEDAVVSAARLIEAVARDLAARSIRRVVFVPGRLVNLIVG